MKFLCLEIKTEKGSERRKSEREEEPENQTRKKRQVRIMCSKRKMHKSLAREKNRHSGEIA